MKKHIASARIRRTNGSYTVTIPKFIGELLQLSSNDKLEFIVEEYEDHADAVVSFIFDEDSY